MGDKGSKDKGRREQQKKAKLTPKEKRKEEQIRFGDDVGQPVNTEHVFPQVQRPPVNRNQRSNMAGVVATRISRSL